MRHLPRASSSRQSRHFFVLRTVSNNSVEQTDVRKHTSNERLTFATTTTARESNKSTGRRRADLHVSGGDDKSIVALRFDPIRFVAFLHMLVNTVTCLCCCCFCSRCCYSHCFEAARGSFLCARRGATLRHAAPLTAERSARARARAKVCARWLMTRMQEIIYLSRGFVCFLPLSVSLQSWP